MAKSNWSGLAKAVDAHIYRWQVVEREIRGMGGMANQPMELEEIYRRWPHIGQWYLFAQSYGLPQADGTVTPGVVLQDRKTGEVHRPIPDHEVLSPKAGELVKSGEVHHSDVAAIHEESTIQGREQFSFDTMKLAWTSQILHAERQMLGEAVSHYISGPVVAQITAAAELAEAEPIFHTDVITPYGFAVLEHPIVLPDVDPDTGEVTDDLKVGVRAFGWMPATVMSNRDDGTRQPGPGLQMILYGTPQDYLDYFIRSYEETRGPYPIPWEHSIAGQLTSPYDFYALDVLPWAFGTPWEKRQGATHEDGKIVASVAHFRRWFMTLMRFCWQEILVEGGDRLDRAATKRLLRSSKPTKDYTVLRLRRVYVPGIYDEAEHGTGEPLGYRLRVRGHWKRQYCPSLGPHRLEDGTWNPESHRLMWIDPYYKGPEDGPMGPEHAATSVVR
jgi:hypothetical protein